MVKRKRYSKRYWRRKHHMGRRKNAKYIPLSQAAAVVQLESIQSRLQYWKWWDTWEPEELPKFPNKVYSDWVSWPTFLGNDNKFTNSEPHKYRKFDDALVYANASGILTSTDWREVAHPDDIPIRPDIVYKGRGFKGWNHFLGKGKQEVMAKLQVAKRLEETQVLMFSVPQHNPPNQVHIGVFPNTDLASKFLKGTGNQYVKAFKLEPGYDWQAVVERYSSDYGDGEWLVQDLNQLLFEIDLEWL